MPHVQVSVHSETYDSPEILSILIEIGTGLHLFVTGGSIEGKLLIHRPLAMPRTPIQAATFAIHSRLFRLPQAKLYLLHFALQKEFTIKKRAT